MTRGTTLIISHREISYPPDNGSTRPGHPGQQKEVACGLAAAGLTPSPAR